VFMEEFGGGRLLKREGDMLRSGDLVATTLKRVEEGWFRTSVLVFL